MEPEEESDIEAKADDHRDKVVVSGRRCAGEYGIRFAPRCGLDTRTDHLAVAVRLYEPCTLRRIRSRSLVPNDRQTVPESRPAATGNYLFPSDQPHFQ